MSHSGTFGRGLTAVRYGSAGLIAAAGVLVAWLEPVLDASVVLLVAIVLATWFSGLGPRSRLVLATLASTTSSRPPLYTITVEFAHISLVCACSRC